MNAPDVAYQVARQFAALRRRYLTVRLIALIGFAMAAVLLWLAVIAAIDFRWELSREIRQRSLLTGCVCIAVAAGWRLVMIMRQTRQRAFAGILERSFDDFGQRIRTVLDTVDGKVSGPFEMLRALGNQTLGRWDLAMPNRIVPMRLLQGGLVALGAMAALVAMLFFSGGDLRLALSRALGSNRPYTILEVTPGDVKVLEGTPVTVSLDLVGRTDREVVIRYREILPTDSTIASAEENADHHRESMSDWIESELLPEGDSSKDNDPSKDSGADPRRKRFALLLGEASVPIEYQFIAAGQSTKIFRIEIQPLIEVESLAVDVTPPAYTGLQPRLFDRNELTVLENSEVNVTIKLNHPLASTELLVGPKKSKLQPVELIPGDNPRIWTFALPTSATTRWTFSGAGLDGTPMDSISGRLGIRRDAAPAIRWNEPSDEIRVHTLAEVPMSVQVSDDYGLVESGIAFQIGGDDEYVLTDWIAQEDENDSTLAVKTRIKLSELLPLETFQLTERDYIAYYAYAIDNRPWGPHRTESDVRYIDIRPLRQFYREVDPMPNLGNGQNRVLVQLDELIRRERFIINRTRRLVREGVDLARELGTIDRLVKNQSELADLTRFLTEFFLSRGNDDVEALSQAESSMLQAADSLAAGELDLAFAQQQDALRSLVEARQTLEIILMNNMSPQQQRQLSRFARQLQQKLRRQRPQNEREIADTLRQIAGDQRRLTQVASQMASSSQADGKAMNASVNPTNGNAGSNASPRDDDEATENAEGQSSDDRDADQSPESSEGDQADPTDADSTDAENGSDSSQVRPSGSGIEDTEPEQSETSDREMITERQIELLERLETVRDDLESRLQTSPLLATRMDEAMGSLDALVDQTRQEEMDSFATGGQVASDLLEEMSAQLEALSADEPVTRISSLRDLTAGMGMLERKLSGETMKSATTGTQPKTDSDEQEVASQAIERSRQRLDARAETLNEVLSSQAEIGDIEMSEVNDRLRDFAEETEFLDLLAATKKSIEQIDASETEGRMAISDAANERSRDYIDAAQRLDRLYQQLVTPRLARLRQMEGQASQMANQMRNGSGGSAGEKAEMEAQMRQLAQELRDESLRELAEILEGGGGEEEIDPQSQSTAQEDQDPMLENERSSGIESLLNGTQSGGALPLTGTASGRLQVVAEELRRRIQQVILLEIAVDRDTPIPSEYRRAVDGYFRTLSSDQSRSTEMTEAASTGVGR
ncbi:coiled-coil domain-containing protein [Roseiconus lacunae]|uniref:hypothetical protein n=1 Tax=Roseiconus lacunae TaxID=2605694 RepID=UPI001E5FB109|nr:hypothetical protein [Roseiconus lacunae]MCD0461087.1 hypothetical protein [Roseiconus lacunae]